MTMVTGATVSFKTNPRYNADSVAVHFGSSKDSRVVYDGVNDEWTVQTKDAAGAFQDRLRIKANTNTPDVDLVGNPVKWTAGRAVTAADYSVGRDADATNQIHMNVPTGASLEFSVNDVEQLKMSATGAVFNETGADTDFRVESDTNPNMIVMDAGAELVSFGEAANPAFPFNVALPTLTVGNGGAAQRFAGTVSGAGADALWGAVLGPHTLTRTAAITTVAGARFRPPTLGGAGSSTNGATVYVDDAPTGSTNNYAFWVDAGLVRWDDPIALGGGVAPTLGTIGGAGPATAAQNQWLRVNINGTTLFIPVWA